MCLFFSPAGNTSFPLLRKEPVVPKILIESCGDICTFQQSFHPNQISLLILRIPQNFWYARVNFSVRYLSKSNVWIRTEKNGYCFLTRNVLTASYALKSSTNAIIKLEYIYKKTNFLLRTNITTNNWTGVRFLVRVLLQ